MEDEKKANELSGTNSTSEAPDQTLDDVVIKTKRDVFSNRMKYFKGHPKQVEFEENLLDFVTEVGPLNVVDKGSFVKLCRGLDKNIWIPSRRTIGRMLLEACKTKVKWNYITNHDHFQIDVYGYVSFCTGQRVCYQTIDAVGSSRTSDFN